MNYSLRMKRLLVGSAAGAMVLATVPTGIAAADVAAVCDGAPDNEFDDVSDTATHKDRIDCLAAYAITVGVTENTYEPGEAVDRGQMATFIARFISQAEDGDLDFPTNAPDAFDDDDGTTHEDAINYLADIGVVAGTSATTYEPGESVTRGQMARFIANALEYIGVTLPAAPADAFEDDDGTTHEPKINELAEMQIVTGFNDDTYRPGEDVTRAQMATFITGAAGAADEQGEWFGVMVTEPAPTNQSYSVSPSAAQTVEANDNVEFTVTGITASTVDIALFECDDVTNTGGTVTFADANDDDVADWNTADTNAVITEVNDVVGAYGDYVNNAAVADGGISFTVTSGTDECVAPVVFNDADNDNALDLDADNAPTEEFGVASETTFGTVAAVNATPESEINRFGTNHTITATLEDAADETVALDGEVIRFQVLRGGTCDTTLDTVSGGTVVATGSDTTEDGVATFTYTLADPNPNTAGDDTDDCIVVFWDENNNSVNDDTHEDVVSKTWSDADATATTLELTPETDTNLVGTQHTVTASVTDQFGDPVDSTVRFEVYRDGAFTSTFATDQATGSDGVATFTYTGPATDADDVIVACVEDGGDGVCSTDGGATFDAPGDSATKFWVEEATTGDYAGDVVGFDTTADNVDLELIAGTADGTLGDNLRFLYDSGDQFVVGAAPSTQAEFEEALDDGDTVTVDYNPDGVSVFTITP